MEQYFNNIFEDVRYERALILLLSLADSDILRQSKFTDHEIDIEKKYCFTKTHRQKNLKEIVALDLLEKQIDDNI